MACGCNKKTVTTVPAGAALSASAAPAPEPARMMYDVYRENGSLVASYSNPVTARSESRRVGGNVVPRNTKTSPAPAGEITTDPTEGSLD